MFSNASNKNENKYLINYKARLEKKLYLARENPEPVFDLSDCNLKNVPNNIFSLCKVFRKEALYLQNNSLVNLNNGGSLDDLKDIKVLNLSINQFTQIPNKINVLENLEILDISKNLLKEIPESIGSLKNLVCLNLSHNNLQYLPDSLGNCSNMKVINISFNENLKKLPPTLGKLQSLVELFIDPTIVYPPKEICEKGVIAILDFFLKELGENVEISASSKERTKDNKNSKELVFYDSLQEELQLQEKLREEKKKQMLNVEKQLFDVNQREVELQQESTKKKKELLENVIKEQKALDAQLVKAQEEKSCERALLLKLCQQEKQRSNVIISKLLDSNKKLRLQISESEMQKKKDEEEKLLFTRFTESREVEKKQILISMDKLMREEIQKAQEFRAEKRIYTVESLASEITKQNEILKQFIKEKIENRNQLMDILRQNEELQKSAVISLLEKSDASTWKLSKQVSIIEAQLAELTRIELSQRRLQTDYHIMELSMNRIALTNILVDLFDQQSERRKHLVETVRKMETLKESYSDSDTFWMKQYDKLLNSKAHQMVKFFEAVHSNLAYELFLNGVFHYLPLLKDVALSEKELAQLDIKALSKLGVKSAEDRSAILSAIKSFLSSQYLNTPSAPELEPSAPLLSEYDSKTNVFPDLLVPDECVICLEFESRVVFIPCGHICCCYKCFTSIALCPLCQKAIDGAHELLRLQ